MDDLLLHALQILVVDDDRDSRDLLVVALESEGAEVISVSSAREALDKLQDWQPDIIISDIRMPEGDGYSLMRQIRDRAIDIPAIALTAFARDEDRISALAAGFQCHLTKPVDLLALYHKIAGLTGRTTP